MEGQILGSRYELLEKIGGGGMALVYKAKCHMLNRFVAVKILRSEFTNDEEFVKRFKIEAQAAASLSHPNIVSIYDVGHEGNIHYIVMEYVDGITLKEYITRKGALDWREAIEISIQICSAMEHAHRNHIVHRDIKPHNILITDEGVLKVTDFGIARAVSSSTITMVGSTIGSVHYFSPEQARGGFIDEKSDIYSLGITLYEMVTGRLPFDGDTPVSVALKHIQDEAESPVNINSSIPNGVNDIIMKAIKKEQRKRYQSASDMLQDLYRVLKDPNGSFVTDEGDTDNCPTKRIQAISSGNQVKREEFLEREEKRDKEGENKRKDKLTVILGVATALIIIVISVIIGYNTVIPSIWPEQGKDFVVGDYKGRNINDVEEELAKSGIKPRITRQNNSDVEKDIIISQKPEEGQTLKPGGYSYIELVVSNGPEEIRVPDLTKIDSRAAESQAEELGLVPKIEDEYSDSIASGLVTRTDPAEGENVKSGDTIIIYRSMGPELKKTRVPNLIGLTESQAKQRLADAGLTIGKIFPEGISNYSGKVIKQEPEAETEVDESTPVNIYFNKTANERVSVNRIVSLKNPQNYPDVVQVIVKVIPSDTNSMEEVFNGQVKKTDSFTVTIPVPDGGKTDVKIFANNILDQEFTQDISSGR